MLGFCKELFVRFVVNVVHELEFYGSKLEIYEALHGMA